MLGRSIGLTEGETLSLRDWRESDLYGPVDRLVLEYVEAVKVRLRVPDELYGRLERQFSSRQIMDLSFTVGIADLINRFHATFLTDVDESTLEAVETGDQLAGGRPLAHPPAPSGRPDRLS